MAFCVQADVEQIFGTSNVDSWADLTGADLAATKTARIARAIAYAEDMAKSILRGGPESIDRIDSNTPVIVRDATATLAGVYLYEARGLDKTSPNPDGTPRHRLITNRDEAIRVLEAIRDGKLRLNV